MVDSRVLGSVNRPSLKARKWTRDKKNYRRAGTRSSQDIRKDVGALDRSGTVFTDDFVDMIEDDWSIAI